MMKIGILETGAPPQPLQGRFASYGAMFRQLLGPAYAFATFDVRQGELPDDDRTCDAYVITGSAAGVYDGHPWIAQLTNFVREASGRVPMIGVCFGHQLMAEAFGGKVIKSPKGWGIGLHTYQIWKRADWMDDAHSIAILSSHQDQVVELPGDAQVLAGSDFTAYGVLAYPRRRAISIQSHPEFSPEYARALITLRRDSMFSSALADSALRSLQEPDDRERVAQWFRRFLQGIP